jgi:hypothetical protein
VDVASIIAHEGHAQAGPLQLVEVFYLGDRHIEMVFNPFLNLTDNTAFAFEAVVSREAEIDRTDADDHTFTSARPAS